MEYLADIVKVPADQRTKEQWRKIGQHHAQALVARRLQQMDAIDWNVYLAGVRAGVEHEVKRTLGTKEHPYWMAFAWTLELTVSHTPRVLGKPFSIRAVA